MTDGRSPLDQALDLVFFGPLGLALTAREELPKMVEKGRQRLGSQVMVARMIGEHAVRHGHRVAGSAIRQSTETLVGLGIIPAQPSPSPSAGRPTGAGESGGAGGGVPTAPRAGSDNGRSAESSDATPAASASESVTGSPGAAGDSGSPDAGSSGGAATTTAPGPVSADLAIPGYDSLSASQVGQRLDGLAPDELEAVRRYEAAGRGRRTILNKIAQLQSGQAGH